MKSTFILAATVISSALGVFGTPTPVTKQDAIIYSSPPGVKAPVVQQSVDGNSAIPRPAAANTAYNWVCLVVSPSTLKYGWSQGQSEGSALASATKYCGQADCDDQVCVYEGCVAIEYGKDYFATAFAYGYGSEDGPKAAELANNICQEHTSNCGPAKYYCAEYIS